METLTKAWFLKRNHLARQRTVPEMLAHREKTGASGNCFDLALWLLHELEREKVEAYGVGHDLGTEHAHVAVLALDESGRRYFCDLGDLWIRPLPLDDGEISKRSGYFTGAWVSGKVSENSLELTFDRAGGKQSREHCGLARISGKELAEYGDYSQARVSRPLVEMRLYSPKETTHWEFDDGKSFVSSMAGLEKEEPCLSEAEWSERIAKRTGMHSGYVKECMAALRELKG